VTRLSLELRNPDMEKKPQDNRQGEVIRSEVPSFHFLTYSILGFWALTVLSGIFLAVHYIPTLSQAFSSVGRLNEEVPFGWMARRLHAAGGSLLLVLLLFHLLRVFYTGAYKARSRMAWVLEVLLVLCTVWVNFTGSFLPLSQSAFWGTTTLLSNLSSLPWIGGFIAAFLRGGRDLGGSALVRFYSMHIGFSVLTGLFLLFYGRMKATGETGGDAAGSIQNLPMALAATILLLTLSTFAPGWFTDSLKEAASPTLNPERILFPWYLLFLPETLPFISAAYPFGSLILVGLVLLFLFLLPFIDRNPERGLLLRPFVMALGAALLVIGIYFSMTGAANARYGERVFIPTRGLSAIGLRGARVFAEKNCAYCHQVAGKGGRRQGPDMTGVSRRGRSRDWIQRFICNARLYQPGTAMPRYEIPLEDLEALSVYLLSLDPRKGPLKKVDRAHLLDATLYLEVKEEGER
jgi:quinol-cytochrome oxidoreductase complex cytochrome b subunit